MTNITRVVLAVDSTQVRQGTADLRAMQGAGQGAETAVASIGKRLFALSAGVVSVGSLASKMIDVSRSFDIINASLITATGSAQGASKAFANIQKLAATTPFDVKQVAEAFVKLKNLGLDPTNEAIISYSNTASAMGKSLSQVVEAVADATTGEFERLKEFGIKARSEGDNVSLTFRGLTTTIGKNAEEIEDYIRRIGDVEFAGSVEQRAKTLDGALSNLGDTWDNLFLSIKNAGAGDAIKDVVLDATSAIDSFSKNLDKAGDAVTVVAIVIGGKFAGAVAVSTAALYAQAVAATRATVTVDALGMATARTTAATTAMAAASRAGAAALAFLGGPVGVAVIAAGAIYTFREELGLVEKPAEDADKAVRDLAAGIDTLTQAEARNRLGNIADKIGEITLAAKEQQRVVDQVARMAQQAAGNAGLSAILDRERAKLEKMQGQIFTLAKSAQQARTAMQAGGTMPSAGDAKTTGATAAAVIPDKKPDFDWASYMSDYARSLDSTGKALNDAADAYEQLKRKADPAYKLMMEHKELREQLDEAIENGVAKDEADAIYIALTKVEKKQDDVRLSTIETMKVMQGAFERGTKGYGQLEVAIQGVNSVQQIQKALSADSSKGIGAMAGAYSMAAAAVGTFLSALDAIGGKFTDTAAERQAAQGISLFGDKSESIANSTEITARATSDLVGLNRSMLTALTGVRTGIAGTATQAVRGARGASFNYGGAINVNQTGGAATDLSFGLLNALTFGIFDGLFKSIGKALFGGKSKITDQGIMILGGTMGDLIQEAVAGAYQETQFKKYRWSGTRTAEAFTEDSALGQQIGLVFEGIADSVYAGAMALGISGQAATDAINSFVLETQRISLKGLSAAEQQAEIEAVFSTIFDDLTTTVVPFLTEFQNAGEALGETLARVATNVQVTEAAAARLGFTAERIGVEQFATLSTALIDAAGGLDAFLSGMASFIERMAPAAYQADLVTSDLTAALDRVGLAVPATRDAMWELMQTLDAGTESGRSQIAALLSVTDLADQYYDHVEDGARAAEDAARSAADAAQAAADHAAAASAAIASERAGLERQLLQAQGDTAALRALDLAALDASNRGLQERIWAIEDEKTAQQQAQEAAQKQAQEAAQKVQQVQQAATQRMTEAANALRSELSGIGSALQKLRAASPAARAGGRSEAVALLQRAMVTGDLTGTGAAAGIASDIDAASFASAADFQREAGRTMFLLDTLEREGKMQLSAQERSADYLENIDRNIARANAMPTAAVPGYAAGGYHNGGLRIIGERGPELEMTGPSRITSNSDLSAALSANSELLAEVRDLKNYIRQTTKNTGESRDILNRWNREGMPEQRELAL